MNPERAIAYRKQAAALIDAVLNDEILPRTALNCWPTWGNEDLSVRCAYTMLWYFEADEDRHKVEPFYADLQIKTLQEANACLREGLAIPSTLMKDYQKVSAPPEYEDSWVWRAPLWWIRYHVNQILTILETNPLFRAQKISKSKGPHQKGKVL